MEEIQIAYSCTLVLFKVFFSVHLKAVMRLYFSKQLLPDYTSMYDGWLYGILAFGRGFDSYLFYYSSSRFLSEFLFCDSKIKASLFVLS